MVDLEKIFADHHLGDATFLEVKDVEGQTLTKAININIGPFQVGSDASCIRLANLFTCCNSSKYLSRRSAP